MAEKFEKSAPKRPSLIVSLPVELFNKRLRKLEGQTSYPVSCQEVTSTTGDYYGPHGARFIWKQSYKKRADSTSLNNVERKDITQPNILDCLEQPKIKDERLE